VKIDATFEVGAFYIFDPTAETECPLAGHWNNFALKCALQLHYKILRGFSTLVSKLFVLS
jgi:hypothetical protein